MSEQEHKRERKDAAAKRRHTIAELNRTLEQRHGKPPIAPTELADGLEVGSPLSAFALSGYGVISPQFRGSPATPLVVS